jgi:hypothetical protein
MQRYRSDRWRTLKQLQVFLPRGRVMEDERTTGFGDFRGSAERARAKRALDEFMAASRETTTRVSFDELDKRSEESIGHRGREVRASDAEFDDHTQGRRTRGSQREFGDRENGRLQWNGSVRTKGAFNESDEK